MGFLVNILKTKTVAIWFHLYIFISLSITILRIGAWTATTIFPRILFGMSPLVILIVFLFTFLKQSKVAKDRFWLVGSLLMLLEALPLWYMFHTPLSFSLTLYVLYYLILITKPFVWAYLFAFIINEQTVVKTRILGILSLFVTPFLLIGFVVPWLSNILITMLCILILFLFLFQTSLSEKGIIRYLYVLIAFMLLCLGLDFTYALESTLLGLNVSVFNLIAFPFLTLLILLLKRRKSQDQPSGLLLADVIVVSLGIASIFWEHLIIFSQPSVLVAYMYYLNWQFYIACILALMLFIVYHLAKKRTSADVL